MFKFRQQQLTDERIQAPGQNVQYSPVGAYGSLEITETSPAQNRETPWELQRKRWRRRRLCHFFTTAGIASGVVGALILVLWFHLRNPKLSREASSSPRMPGQTVPMCIEMTCSAEVGACASDASCERVVNCLFDTCSWSRETPCETCFEEPPPNDKIANLTHPSSPSSFRGNSTDNGSASRFRYPSNNLEALKNCTRPCLVANMEMDDDSVARKPALTPEDETPQEQNWGGDWEWQ